MCLCSYYYNCSDNTTTYTSSNDTSLIYFNATSDPNNNDFVGQGQIGQFDSVCILLPSERTYKNLRVFLRKGPVGETSSITLTLYVNNNPTTISVTLGPGEQWKENLIDAFCPTEPCACAAIKIEKSGAPCEPTLDTGISIVITSEKL